MRLSHRQQQWVLKTLYGDWHAPLAHTLQQLCSPPVLGDPWNRYWFSALILGNGSRLIWRTAVWQLKSSSKAKNYKYFIDMLLYLIHSQPNGSRLFRLEERERETEEEGRRNRGRERTGNEEATWQLPLSVQAAITKYPKTEWLIEDRNLFLTVLEAGSLSQHGYVLVRCFLGRRLRTSPCILVLTWQKERKVLWSNFF